MNNKNTSILFIDSSVDNYDFLLGGVVENVEKIVLDAKRDGIKQITDVLARRNGIETAHIVSHGSPGCVYLGNTQLSLSTFEYYKEQLGNWCQNLFIYGCNVGAGDAGKEFVEKLYRLTGANIAASATKTGSVELGGNWDLEIRVGSDFVENDIALIFEQHTLAEYSGVFAPGDLDTTFGNGGKVFTDFNNGNIDTAYDIAIQPDGKILVVGETSRGTGDFAIARYNLDGTLDLSFGNNGKVITQISSDTDTGYDLAIQSDGKIVLVGNTQNGTQVDIAIARYNADGSLDNQFGNSGKVVTDFENKNDYVKTVAIQSDGKIIVGGRIQSNNTHHDPDFALIRYNTDGTLDTGFGVGGRVITAVTSGQDLIDTIIIQPDGKILAVGSAGLSDFALVSYNVDGSLNTSFGNGGKVLTDFGNKWDFGNFAAIQPDGKIVVAGFTGDIDVEASFALARYNADGSLDSSFGNNGKVVTAIGNSYAWAESLVITPSGKIIVSGVVRTNDKHDFTVVAYNSDGSLDQSFGDSGKVITIANQSRYSYRDTSMALQSDGKIIVAGSGNNDFTLMRYEGYYNLNLTLSNSNLNYTENAIQIIDANATLTDIDSPNFNNGSLTVKLASGSSQDDRLSIRNQGTQSNQINLENTTVKYGDLEIGTFSGGIGTTQLVINFNANATPAMVQELLRNITYRNLSDNPSATLRTVEFIVSDGSGGVSEAVSKSINITAVNDAPKIDNVMLRVDENARKGTVVGTLTANDPDGTTNFSDWRLWRNSQDDLDGDGEAAFAIDPNTGRITVNDSDDLNYEKRTSYSLQVSVSDGTLGSLPTPIPILINNVKGVDQIGTPDNDNLYGTPEAEMILGNAGNDNISGGGGNDTIDGGEGTDTIRATVNGDFQLDDNQLRINSPIELSISSIKSIERASLTGGTRNNIIEARRFSGNVYLSGEAGNDTLIGGWGNDILSGGEGNDILDGFEGIDTVRESADADFTLINNRLESKDSKTRINLGSDQLVNIERLIITGGESNNIIDVKNFYGDVNLAGEGGRDSLFGGWGNDILSGGEGDDTFDGGAGIDTVRESADADFILNGDRLNSQDSKTRIYLSSDRLFNIEKLSLTGGESNNRIEARNFYGDVNLAGEAGNDTLIGGLGNDILSGGEGNDTLDGGAGIDTVRETADADFQLEDFQQDSQLKITDSNTGGQLSIDRLINIERVQLTGGESNNKLDASRFSGSVNLSGEAGNDSLLGGRGDDILSGGEGSDTIDGGAGIDTLRETADVNIKLTENQLTSNDVKTGTIAIDKLSNIEKAVLTGGTSNNIIDAKDFKGDVNLSGEAGNDSLIGGSGDDILSGGEGDDTLDGGDGFDTVRETADANFVFISDRLESRDSKTGTNLGRDQLLSIERLVITGGESNNQIELFGFNGDGNLSGEAGNDSLFGGRGNDILSGGMGNDTLDGREGIDTVRETQDADFILTNNNLESRDSKTKILLGRDQLKSIERLILTGGDGNNTIDARSFDGDVNLSGEAGNDSLVGGRGNDILSGGIGNDTLDGGDGFDTVREKNDANFRIINNNLESYNQNTSQFLGKDLLINIERIIITGGESNNFIDLSSFNGDVNLSGEVGNDTLIGGRGNDILSGGEGFDTLDGGEGFDTVRESADADFILTNNGLESRDLNNNIFLGRDQFLSIERLILIGGESNNIIDVRNFDGDVNLSGEAGRDSLVGGWGNDILSGGAGDDTLDGREGFDTVRESADVDFIFNGDRLESKDSNTNIFLGRDQLKNIERLILTGGESDNIIDVRNFDGDVNLAGEAGRDILIGGRRNDTLSGGAGDDTLDGGDGFDTVRETADADFRVISSRLESIDSKTKIFLGRDELRSIERLILTGGESNNIIELFGFNGDGNLSGEAGNDSLVGGWGNDTISGGAGDDTLDGREGFDTVRETQDVDFILINNSLESRDSKTKSLLGRDELRNIERLILTGGDGNNTINASSFNGDVNLAGEAGNDSLIAGIGDDTLSGGAGNDTLDGGAGIDTLRETQDVDFILINDAVESRDSKTKSLLGRDELRNIERLILTGGDSNNTINASSFNGNVNLSGEAGNDSLTGGMRDDTLSGGEGNDTLDGGAGINTLRETANVNLYLSDSYLDFVDPQFGRQLSRDEIRNIQRAILSGGSNSNRIDASGFSGNTFLYGNEGNDTLMGGEGDDNLDGGQGNDSLNGGAGTDTIRETGDVNFILTNNQLEIRDIRIPINSEIDRLTSIERAILSGGASNNIIDARQFTGNVFLYGNEGNDSLMGGEGDDNLYGGEGSDTLNGGAGTDTIRETIDGDFRLADNYLEINQANPRRSWGRDTLFSIERAVLTGGESRNVLDAGQFTGQVFLYGQGGNDTLWGGRGNDILKGGQGDDILDGRDGNDRLYGEAGRDIFVIRSGMGRDTIYDFEDGLDRLGLFNGLSFNDLEIRASGDSTNILQGNQVLVTLLNVNSNLISQSDFIL
ncbi:DUF4347 domain-containing protein [Plectonema cf. radiosum LEGE 06105]|uniref:DUF4347 domain-containing protein n=1 Tax=Plectonema cf. radiosum LEGE 06105 TaxID=945769 RepID=A0A8J7K176_9CYAN|nr:DUF4347 domain-containing protein [Plectonema radiosum]MBE9211527.1 DUF4347 domain-containing protein [Plectonema cf. radiosum LEGE 06105]